VNRREFVQYLALTAAGAAALPKQVAAFEQYYDINTPRTPGPYMAMDEVSISGLVPYGSTPLQTIFYQRGAVILNASFNAFGGLYFWRAPPDGKVITNAANEITWKMVLRGTEQEISDEWVKSNLEGHIRFVDSDGVRQCIPIDKARGTVI
jgi:hypothetical protein